MFYAGYDKVMGYQLYCSDPSGNYAAWNAHATGKNSVNSITTLKDEYKAGCSLNEALMLAIKILAKSMDVMKPNADKFEVGIVTRGKDGQVIQREVVGAELDAIIKEGKIHEMKEKDKK